MSVGMRTGTEEKYSRVKALWHECFQVQKWYSSKSIMSMSTKCLSIQVLTPISSCIKDFYALLKIFKE